MSSGTNPASPRYEIAPWELRWTGLDLDALQRTESSFALSNGHLGLRGTFEEAEPRGLPGTYLNGFYESRPLPYAEAGYGYPESGQTVVNVTDGKIVRLLVGDEPLDMRYGQAPNHSRVLDFRRGTLRRSTEWISPTGRRLRITSERLVSFTQRAVAAIHYEVEPLDSELQLVAQSDLLANEPIETRTNDPRVAAALRAPLQGEFASVDRNRAVLVHRTHNSGLRMAAAMDHVIDDIEGLRTDIYVEQDLARLTAAADVPVGQKLRFTKFLGYGWSGQRSAPALRSQVEAALAGAMQTGWEGLLAEQREYLNAFWAAADIEVDGDPELQQALRFALFSILQAGARGETRAIPAKGLSGPGYDGHAFWDTETFVLPVLTYTVPDAARDALYWRHSTLDKAKDRAEALGLEGAAFPWRSINGDECSAYWPAGTAAFHVNADIADAVTRYVKATDDREFEQRSGTELLVESARLWRSLGHHDPNDGFRIDGVTGPDEYTAVVDNNVYTNLMAKHNLRSAVEACRRWPEVAGELAVTEEELNAWSDAAEQMRIPYDEKLGVHPQSENFTAHAEWDFDDTPNEYYPLLLNYPYFELYRKQVIKQADLVLAMQLRGGDFTFDQKVRNVAYYEARTVRDSSLSAATQAVLAAEVGDLDLAYNYLCEAAFTDLHDVHDNVRNGLHIAAMGGAWSATVAGFGGMRDYGELVTFAPRLPSELRRISFGMYIRGRRLNVDIHQGETTYELFGEGGLEIGHHGETLRLQPNSPRTVPIPELERPILLEQPVGRAPTRRLG